MMLYREIIRTAWHSLYSNPKRTFLTMLGIIVSVSSVIIIISLGNGIKNFTLKNLQSTKDGHQTINISYTSNNMEDYNPGFNTTDIDLIENSNVNNISNIKIKQENHDFEVFGTVGNNLKSMTTSLVTNNENKYHLLAGHKITKYDQLVNNNVALISNKLAIHEFKTLKNALNKSLQINKVNYTIIGIYKQEQIPPYDTQVLIPKSTYSYFEHNQNNGNTLIITFKKHANIQLTTKKIISLLKSEGSHRYSGQYDFINTGDLLKGIGKIINGLTYFIGAIAGISLIIAGIGVMNMMYISVSERTQEIGIKLAVGASSKTIMLQFLFEAMILTLSGGIIGLILGSSVAYIISLLLPFRAVISIESIILSISVSLLVGIIFGILPAKRAANKNLIEIIR